MQVIEKVKVVPEGYNGAGMDGYGRRDVNGKANAGLTLGIIGTALGAWALFGNRRSAGVLGTGAGLMGDGSTNINVVDEEIEIIKSIPNFDFNIPVLGNGNISNGNITLSIPFINKGIMFNQSDLETFRQLLTK